MQPLARSRYRSARIRDHPLRQGPWPDLASVSRPCRSRKRQGRMFGPQRCVYSLQTPLRQPRETLVLRDEVANPPGPVPSRHSRPQRSEDTFRRVQPAGSRCIKCTSVRKHTYFRAFSRRQPETAPGRASRRPLCHSARWPSSSRRAVFLGASNVSRYENVHVSGRFRDDKQKQHPEGGRRGRRWAGETEDGRRDRARPVRSKVGR